MNRRNFLQVSSIAALSSTSFLRAQNKNSKLRVAFIAVGGMGRATLNSIASHPMVEVVALCDVDQTPLEEAGARFPHAKKIADWRELFAKHANEFDAVAVATPDHTHTGPAITALRAKKHLYLQKPMAPTLQEVRFITEEARKHQVVTQLGNQGRSSLESRMTVDLLKQGAIGKVKEVIIWENKALSWWPKNTTLRATADPIPANLNWDLWLGPRPERPFLSNTYDRMNWRAWFDFGCGELGDMGCHHFDNSLDALSLSAPIRVKQHAEGSSGPLWGTRNKVEFTFAGTSLTASDELTITWHDADIRPDLSKILLPKGVKEVPESGTFWVGEKGSIFKNYRGGRPFVLPEANFPADQYPRDYAKQDHYHEWVNAILENRKACGYFDHGGVLSEIVLVGALADRFPGQTLEWDSTKLQFTNQPEANKLIKRESRKGWEIEGLS